PRGRAAAEDRGDGPGLPPPLRSLHGEGAADRLRAQRPRQPGDAAGGVRAAVAEAPPVQGAPAPRAEDGRRPPDPQAPRRARRPRAARCSGAGRPPPRAARGLTAALDRPARTVRSPGDGPGRLLFVDSRSVDPARGNLTLPSRADTDAGKN